MIGIYVLLVPANIAAWIIAWISFADRPGLLGIAFAAWVFGLRHAIDADHIAAIDNVVRKLMQDGKRPQTVGLFFSLGHSTVVVLASAAIAFMAAILRDRFETFRDIGGLIGTSISAGFLIAMGLGNLVILTGVWRCFSAARAGQAVDDTHLDTLLSNRGLLARIFRRLFPAVSQPWQMYPLGFLFGLGFDTATEIGLLGISAGQAAHGMSPGQTLIFPLLFTAGMSLVDTTDSVLMTSVYGWAFVNPLRKLWYNLTITAASVAVALVIGGIEALGLIGDKLHLDGLFWRLIANLNSGLANVGIAVIGLFTLSWILSSAIYRWRGYDGGARGVSL